MMPVGINSKQNYSIPKEISIIEIMTEKRTVRSCFKILCLLVPIQLLHEIPCILIKSDGIKESTTLCTDIIKKYKDGGSVGGGE